MQEVLFVAIFFGGITMIFVTIFGYFAYTRYLKHKETIALAEKGLIQPEQVVQYNGKNGQDRKLLNRAIILIAIGFALSLGLFPIGFLVADGFPFFFGPWMIVGLLPLFFGIALLVIYAIPHFPILLKQLSTTNSSSNGGNPNINSITAVEEIAADPTPEIRVRIAENRQPASQPVADESPEEKV